MAEPMLPLLTRTHPLKAWADSLAALTASVLPESVRITVEPFVSMVDVRLAAQEATALGLPAKPNTWQDAGDGRAVWLGPDEWLLTSPTEMPEALEQRLRATAVPVGGAAANVSAQRVTLRLNGSRVRELLAKGCSIDLHPSVFTRGRCAQTTLGQAGVVLLALGDEGDDYLVLVRSSFAGYLADWLLDAALEYADL